MRQSILHITVGLLMLVLMACSRSDAPAGQSAQPAQEQLRAGNAASAFSGEEDGEDSASLDAVGSVSILPETPHGGQDLMAQIEDEHEGRLYGIEWYVDGERVAGVSGSVLSSAHIRKGASVEVAVSPSVGDEYGPETRSPAVLIVNRPPEVQGADIVDGNDQHVVLQVRAVDPDNDPLTYTLLAGPDGMSVNSASGRVDWRVPSGFSGTAEYQVKISDGEADIQLDGIVQGSIEQFVEQGGD
jgi:hypothetical protein